MKKVYINDYSCFSSLGLGVQKNWTAVQNLKSGIQKIEQFGAIENFNCGKIKDQWIDQAWNELNIQAEYSRLEKIMILTLKPLVEKYQMSENTALVLATTKGNIDFLENLPTEKADLHHLAKKIQDFFQFKNTPIILSNACVSGTLAVAVAKRFIQMNRFSDAYVLAGDEVTSFVLSGFKSFQAMSDEICQPFDQNRKGINLGEAAAAAYLSTVEIQQQSFEILGESSIADANHISGPSRTAEGLFLSIQNALKEAKIDKNEIDCISAHGTATIFNDEMESIAIDRMALNETPIHSLKAYFGHTLGAAGLLELIMVMESLKNNQRIVSKGFEKLGVSKELNITTKKEAKRMKIALKTASGFGGVNTALLIEKK